MLGFRHTADGTIRVGDPVRSAPRPTPRTPVAYASGKSSAQLVPHGPIDMPALWSSLQEGLKSQSQSQDDAFMGIVTETDGRHCKVKIWKKGGKFEIGPRKPEVSVPTSTLRKVSSEEFNRLCRKPYMYEVNYQLRLRSQGFDESAPFALIAHNNRIISNIIDKIDTRAKMSLKDLRKSRPQGPGTIKKAPIPSLAPVEDPLADVREELRSLAAGVVQRKKKPPSTKKQEELPPEDIGSEEVDDISYFEDNMHDETARMQSELASRMETEYDALQNAYAGKLLPQSSFKRHHGDNNRTFLSAMDEPSLEDYMRCTVVSVRGDGVLTAKPSTESLPMFQCIPLAIDVWKGCKENDGISFLKNLEGCKIGTIPIKRNIFGTTVARIMFNNEPIHESLVMSGLARILPSDVQELSQQEQKTLERLETEAKWGKRGLWAKGEAEQEGAPVDIEGDSEVPLRPLFNQFESSFFRKRLEDARNQDVQKIETY